MYNKKKYILRIILDVVSIVLIFIISIKGLGSANAPELILSIFMILVSLLMVYLKIQDIMKMPKLIINDSELIYYYLCKKKVFNINDVLITKQNKYFDNAYYINYKRHYLRVPTVNISEQDLLKLDNLNNKVV